MLKYQVSAHPCDTDNLRLQNSLTDIFNQQQTQLNNFKILSFVTIFM